MKVALIHDWLYTFAGAEGVLKEIATLFPNSSLFTTVDFLNAKKYFNVNQVYPSFIQMLPFSKEYRRNYLPLMPFAISKFNLSKYDIILSSSNAIAKGVKTRKNQLHICYCHTPMRYAWDLRSQYFNEADIKGLKKRAADFILDKIKGWDYDNSQSVDYFIANSKFIRDRVKNCYGRDAVVINPPVDVESFSLVQEKEDYYLAASRFVPYKKINLIVAAFTKMPDKKLVVIGDGPDFEKTKKLATKNIELLGFVGKEKLIKYMQKAKAFVFAAEEDFGILPVEAQACGTPVIAYGKGGALETVIDGRTGLYFNEQSIESLTGAVDRFEKGSGRFDPKIIRKNAERFSIERFCKEYKSFVEEKYMEFYS